LSSKASHLLKEERCNKTVVIGVPHHAPVGVDRLPCNRWADENTGYLGRYLAQKLNCHSIIACNYTIDANKDMNNDYARQLLQWLPRLLIEIHGHKRKRTNNDVEITCGCTEYNQYSIILAEKLLEKCKNDNELHRLRICGDFARIYFKGKTARTIHGQGWLGFLIELPPELRFNAGQIGGEPPRTGYQFCKYLIESLNKMELI